MIILEYHKFGVEVDEYPWSRTYQQFAEDLGKPIDYIRMDDGWKSQIPACQMAKNMGHKVHLGITVDFIGRPDYMTWDDVMDLARDHIICNHTIYHNHLDDKTEEQIYNELRVANGVLAKISGQKILYYCPTYNFINDKIKRACKRLGLTILDPVLPVSNNMVL